MNIQITITATTAQELALITRAFDYMTQEPSTNGEELKAVTHIQPATNGHAPDTEVTPRTDKPKAGKKAPAQEPAAAEELTTASVQELARKRAMGGKKEGIKK